MSLALQDRVAGCLIGGAIGDALGAQFEGRAPSPEWEWPPQLFITDDTQLTIATCEAICATGLPEPDSISQAFVRWYRQRRIIGVGSSTLKALVELEAGGHWALTGATGERAAGNGAAMRVAPLAFLLDPDDEVERRTIRDICRITHRHDEAYLGALAVLRMLRLVIAGRPLEMNLLAEVQQTLPDSLIRDRLQAALDADCAPGEFAAKFGSSGYVVQTVPLAILTAVRAESLLPAMREIVACGGDADTTASICGQILGAAHGVQTLPLELLERIDARELVLQTSREFSEFVIATNTRN